MRAAVLCVIGVVRQSHVANPPRDGGKPGQQAFPLNDGGGVHARGAVDAIGRCRLVMEQRRPRAEQPSIAARGPTAHRSGIHADDRDALTQQPIDAGKAAAAEPHDADIGVMLSLQWRIRTRRGSVPDGRLLAQK